MLVYVYHSVLWNIHMKTKLPLPLRPEWYTDTRLRMGCPRAGTHAAPNGKGVGGHLRDYLF